MPGGIDIGDYSYGDISSFDDVISQEGLVVVRIELMDEPDLKGQETSALIRVRKAETIRLKTYFLERVVVLWLSDASESTEISLGSKQRFRFTLGELVEVGELTGIMDGIDVKTNFLLDPGKERLYEVPFHAESQLAGVRLDPLVKPGRMLIKIGKLVSSKESTQKQKQQLADVLHD